MRPIDADELLNEINELKKSPWYNGENCNYERLVRSDAIGIVVDLCIKQAPTLDYAPVRHGYWIPVWYDLFKLGYVKCSVCGHKEKKRGFAYCNCGALMDEKEEENANHLHG